MLQDLDSLASRIEHVVQLTRQLQDQCSALTDRAQRAEQERDALRAQLLAQEAEYKDVAAQARRHDAEMAAARAQSDAALESLRAQMQRDYDALKSQGQTDLAQLQAQLQQQQAEFSAVSRNLESSRSESTRLHAALNAARQRIDAVLMRLPGAPQE